MAETTRVAPVKAGTRPELAAIEAVIREKRYGEVPLLYEVLLNSVPVADGWEKFLTAVRHHTTVSPALREMIILRIAVLNRASFEYAAHLPLAVKAGLSEAKIAALQAEALDETLFDAAETAVLRVTDQMTRSITVEAADIQALRNWQDDRGIVELVATVAAYNMVSRFLVALNIVHEH